MRDGTPSSRSDALPTFRWGWPLRPMKPPMRPIRVYRDRMVAVVIWTYTAVSGLLALSFTVVQTVPASARLGALAGGAIAVWIGYRGSRMQVAVTPDGVWLGNGVYSRWLLWPDVERFVAKPAGFFAEVKVTTRDRPGGYRVAVTQGRKMHWNGGSTVDVLGTLSADLLAAREGQLVSQRPASDVVVVRRSA